MKKRIRKQKTRAIELYCLNSPFKQKIVQNKKKYTRKIKHKKY